MRRGSRIWRGGLRGEFSVFFFFGGYLGRTLRLTRDRLRLQRSQFHALAKPPPPQPPPAGPLDASLLDAESAAILSRLTATSASLLPAIEARLQTARAGLEFQTDVFAHGVHALEQAREEMEGVAGRVGEACARRLEGREERERGGGVPVQDVLRALGRVMPGGR